ncbi:hypothetical protein A9Q94_00595 [Rhodobacterales bacterium 56_14_T64]|nr:hypothetical protein A9Q94_00595 [Rhodobacterales bacterium 56_14_T64]
MGSLRGRITARISASLVLLPASVFAEVCDKERPLWNPGDGPATAWNELISLSVLPVQLALFILTAIALTVRQRVLFAATAVLWGLCAIYKAANYHGVIMDDVRYYAIKEGCIGPPDLFIALAIAICALMTYGALRPRT